MYGARCFCPGTWNPSTDSVHKARLGVYGDASGCRGSRVAGKCTVRGQGSRAVGKCTVRGQGSRAAEECTVRGVYDLLCKSCLRTWYRGLGWSCS
jgi:hypothetical protein